METEESQEPWANLPDMDSGEQQRDSVSYDMEGEGHGLRWPLTPSSVLRGTYLRRLAPMLARTHTLHKKTSYTHIHKVDRVICMYLCMS